MLGILNDTEDWNLRSQLDAEVCAIQALSVVSQFIAAQAQCMARMSKGFFQQETILVGLGAKNSKMRQDPSGFCFLLFPPLNLPKTSKTNNRGAVCAPPPLFTGLRASHPPRFVLL